MGRFEDERGIIHDLLGDINAVTEITTRKGCIRGNHIHYQTWQWTYVVSGKMRFYTRPDVVHHTDYGPGSLITEHPGIPHAWLALEDTRVLVFTKGPRAGEDYENDTVRLDPEDRIIA